MEEESIRLQRDSIPLTKAEKSRGEDYATMSLENILNCIRIGIKDEISDYLQIIPIERIGAAEQLLILDALLFKAEEYEFGEFVDFIFTHFDDRLKEVTRLKTFCLFLMRAGLDNRILEFIGRNTSLYSFENFIYDLNFGETSPEVYEACLNAERVFQEMPRETLLKLKMYLCMDPLAKNYYIDRYISEKLGGIEIVKKPEWVEIQTDEIYNHEDLDIPRYPNVKMRSASKYAKEYISLAKEENKDNPELLAKLEDDFSYRLIATQYALVPLEEKVTMLNRLLRMTDGKPLLLKEESATADTTLFMLFGPTNTPYDQVIKRIESDSPCLRYGGCRMFLCLCSETDEDYYEENVAERDDWFTSRDGRCDICKRTITYKHYALRRPLPLGGWKGCFCSFGCLNDSVTDTSDLITPILLSIMTELIMKIKILERSYKDSTQTMV